MVETCELFVLREDVELPIADAFVFEVLKIQKGITVTWETTLMVNADTAQVLQILQGEIGFHQVFEVNGLFDSGPIFFNEKWSYTFNEVGEFEYFCPPHPWMTGKIIVVD